MYLLYSFWLLTYLISTKNVCINYFKLIYENKKIVMNRVYKKLVLNLFLKIIYEFIN